MPIFPTGYTQKTTPHDDDQVLIGDSQASNAIKRTKISSIVTKATAAAVAAVGALTNWITTAMLQNASVTKAKIDFNSGIFWEELGRASLPTGTATSLSIPSFTPKKYIKIIGVQHSGGVPLTSGIRFNNDSGNNYNYRTNENGTESSDLGQSWLQTGSNSLVGAQIEFFMVNEATYYKNPTGMEAFWDNSNGMYRNFYQGQWKNAVSQVSRVDWVATDGSFKAGSELIIVGHD